jgi:RNA polymerase sigma-70 factor (ECF subfamily)
MAPVCPLNWFSRKNYQIIDKMTEGKGLYLRSGSGRIDMNLEELYDRYGEKLYQYLVFKLCSCEDAEDVLQETFYRFARYSVRWKLVKNPLAFVFRAARNEANRYLKQQLKHRAKTGMNPNRQDAIVSVIQGPDEKAESLMADALTRLPDEQREVIVLKAFQGLTFEEIARVCGLSVNTAASRYRYGLSKLRLFLEGKG